MVKTSGIEIPCRKLISFTYLTEILTQAKCMFDGTLGIIGVISAYSARKTNGVFQPPGASDKYQFVNLKVYHW